MKSKILAPAAFVAGCAATLLLVTTLGAEPVDLDSDYDTQFVPAAGGFMLLFTITDHDQGKTFVYQVPGEEDGAFELRGTIDLSSVGDAELVAELNDFEW